MTSPENKFNLAPWQLMSIGAGSTVILGFAAFGLWRFLPPKIFSLTTPETRMQRGKQSEGRIQLGEMSRKQQVFRIENPHFAYTLQELDPELPAETEYYSYAINMIDDKKMVQLIATSKSEELKSYTSIVYLTEASHDIKSSYCKSDKPTMDFPPYPNGSGSNIQCPTGYSPLS